MASSYHRTYCPQLDNSDEMVIRNYQASGDEPTAGLFITSSFFFLVIVERFFIK